MDTQFSSLSHALFCSVFHDFYCAYLPSNVPVISRTHTRCTYCLCTHCSSHFLSGQPTCLWWCRPLVGYAGESAVAKALLPLAWNFANDSLRTGLSVLYPPHMVAITCLHMASKINDVDISEWYSALQVNDAEISEIRAVMLQSYTLYVTNSPHPLRFLLTRGH